MPYYHATSAMNLPSIFRAGLGGGNFERNFPSSVPGVYLAHDPVLAIGFMIEWMLELAPDDLSPAEAVAQWRVIIVDDSRVDPAKLHADPQIDNIDGFFRYDGVIDIHGLAIIDVDQAFVTPQ